LLEKAKEKLQDIPDIALEYLEIHPELNLSQPVFQWQKNVNYRAFIAANIENVRLIDTLKL
jgi:pantothenate synthetase